MWKEATLGCLTRGNYLTIILAGLRNIAEKSVSITVLQDLPVGGSTELRRLDVCCSCCEVVINTLRTGGVI